MIRHRLLVVAAVAWALLAGAVSAASADPPARPRFIVSLPVDDLRPEERIKNFSITIKDGAIVALRQVPRPWRLKLVNELEEGASLEGTLLPGPTRSHRALLVDVLEVEAGPNFSIRIKVETSFDLARIERVLVFADDKVPRRPLPPNP